MLPFNLFSDFLMTGDHNLESQEALLICEIAINKVSLSPRERDRVRGAVPQ